MDELRGFDRVIVVVGLVVLSLLWLALPPPGFTSLHNKVHVELCGILDKQKKTYGVIVCNRCFVDLFVVKLANKHLNTCFRMTITSNYVYVANATEALGNYNSVQVCYTFSLQFMASFM